MKKLAKRIYIILQYIYNENQITFGRFLKYKISKEKLISNLQLIA